MSFQYDQYLAQHKANVFKGYEWIRDNVPEILLPNVDYAWQLEFGHDQSKDTIAEYEAYDRYFYGGNRSYKVVQDFRRAWLHHIHNNPHHWQHWVLINDDPNEGEIILDMEYLYIIEMICDWWAFSWSKENLYEIFKWYDEHQAYMKLSDNTRNTVNYILNKIKKKLDEGVDATCQG